MQNYRFDEKRLLIEVIVTLLNRGVEPEDLDLVLSRVGPVDLDLMHCCLSEVMEYNRVLNEQVQQVAEPMQVAA